MHTKQLRDRVAQAALEGASSNPLSANQMGASIAGVAANFTNSFHPALEAAIGSWKVNGIYGGIAIGRMIELAIGAFQGRLASIADQSTQAFDDVNTYAITAAETLIGFLGEETI